MDRKKLPVIGGRGFRLSNLNEKQCFELWVHRGSSVRASLALKNEFGIYNKTTNKRYTTEAVARAAKRYVLDNTDEARQTYEEKYGELADHIWYEYLSRISPLLIKYSTEVYDKWREQNPEVVAYENSRTEEDVS